jgi:hypothetical protein
LGRQLARRFMMEKFNEIDLTAEDDMTAEDSVPREMGMRRAVFLLDSFALVVVQQYAARPLSPNLDNKMSPLT